MVYSPPYVPQGKGKIERSFRTVTSQFLPSFKGDTLRDINEALECWIRDVYHQDGMRPAGPTLTWKTTSKKGLRAA
ncbi:hypothetical protein DFAR_2030012 [Desulfarculales bacterium]